MRGVVPSLVPLALAAAGALLLAGCPPTCEQMCNKLDRCGLNGTVSTIDCRSSCTQQLESVADNDTDDGDPEAAEGAKKAFRQHRLCISNHSCDELVAGACYQDELYPF